jgi:lysophospholipase L1-like esterase
MPTVIPGPFCDNIATVITGQIGNSIAGTATSASPPANPSLNLPGTPLAVYSMVQSAGWTGKCLQAFRTTDSATLDIGFVNGVVDIAGINAFGATGTVYVLIWYDQSGNGYNLVQDAVVTFIPALDTDNAVKGITPATFTFNVPNAVALSAPTAFSVNSHAFSAFSVQTGYLLEPQAYYSVGYTNPNTVVVCSFNPQSQGAGLSTFDGTTIFNTSMAFEPQFAHPTFTGLVSTAAAQTMYVGDGTQTLAATAALTLTGHILGHLPGSANYPSAADMYAFVIYGSALSSTVAGQVKTAMQNAFSTIHTANNVVIHDGDSITFGNTGPTLNRGVARLATEGLTKPALVYNAGFNAETLATMVTNFSTNVGSIVSAGLAANNIVLLAGGINDLLAGTTAATLEGYLQTYATAVHSAGGKVVFTTITASSALTAGQQTAWTAYNTWIRANWATYADALSDRQANATIGTFAATGNATYFPDGTHLSTAGAIIAGAIDAAAINSLLT